MNEHQSPDPKRFSMARHTESPKPTSDMNSPKPLHRLVSMLDQDFIDECQAVADKIIENELEVLYRGQDTIQKVCWLVESVEAKTLEIRSRGISQKTVSKKSLIEVLTKRSKVVYYQDYFPIWEHRDYLCNEQTELPTSIRHANRIIKNYLSGLKKAEAMATSTQNKTALLELVQKLKEEIETFKAQVKDLTEALEAKDQIILEMLEKKEANP